MRPPLSIVLLLLGVALIASADVQCFMLLRWAAHHSPQSLLLFLAPALAGGIGVKLVWRGRAG